jgi:hypothetical protein
MKKNPSPQILLRTLAVMLILGTLGCAGTTGPASSTSDMVEIPNPGLTMSPNAPETVWVPRSYLEKGVPRGNELVKEGYQALTGKTAAPPTRPVPADTAAAPLAKPVAADTAAAPLAKPMAANMAVAAPTPPVLRDTAGNPAGLIPRFGLVVAVDGERVYFNLGKEDGIAPGQALKVYRGGTVVKGLGLAPGETVGTIQVLGLVGSKGAYGVMKEGEPARASDLIGLE